MAANANAQSRSRTEGGSQETGTRKRKRANHINPLVREMLVQHVIEDTDKSPKGEDKWLIIWMRAVQKSWDSPFKASNPNESKDKPDDQVVFCLDYSHIGQKTEAEKEALKSAKSLWKFEQRQLPISHPNPEMPTRSSLFKKNPMPKSKEE